VSTVQVGTVIDGRYRIDRELGQGGMGSLYIAEQLSFGREVALKVLSRGSSASKDQRERFVREARAICGIQHPNIVTYHDFGTDEATGSMFLVMELLAGRSLAQVHKQERPLAVARVVHMLAQLCDALAASHEAGVIHRDLKPANIMLVPRGDDPDFLKLIDFGIARVTESDATGDELTATGQIIGTTGYLAPEYIRFQHVDVRTDVYALGIIAYELIAGRKPFVDKDLMKVLRMHMSMDPPPLSTFTAGRDWPHLSRIETHVFRALAKDPLERTPTVRAFKAHLLAASGTLFADESNAATRIHSQDAVQSALTTSKEAPAVSASRDTSERTTTRRIAPSPRPEALETVLEEPAVRVPVRPPRPTQPSVVSSKPSVAPLWIGVAGVVIVVMVTMVGIGNWMAEQPDVTEQRRSTSARPGAGPVVDAPTEPPTDPVASPRVEVEVAEAPPVESEREPVASAEPRVVRAAEGPVSDPARRAIDLYVAESPAPRAARTARPSRVAPIPAVEIELFSVTINATPSGPIFYQGARIGTDSVTKRLPAGKRCFSSEAAGSKRCIPVGPGKNNYARVPNE
jgi:serine/threonine protein kinase